MKTEGLTKDPWLSEFLNRPAYHLSDLSAAERVRTLEPRVFCDAKCPVYDVKTVCKLNKAGFYVVDVNLYFEAPSVFCAKIRDWVIRVAKPEDRQAVMDVAGRCFSLSRFHLDPYILPQEANAVKRAWVGNYFLGKRGDLMIVAQKGQEVVGFLQLIKGANGLWIIDLIGVDTPAQGQGAGAAMIGAMTSLCEGITKFGVGTQAANIASVGFYTKLGFILQRAQYVFHYHGDKQ